jgi:hypothetical protein
MNQQLVPFDFEGRPVRVVTDSQGEPWFVAADVLATIGLDRKALERLDDDEKGVSSIHTPVRQDHQPASGRPGTAVPKRSGRMGVDRSRGSLGGGHAVFPKRPQRVPDPLESGGG